MIAIDTNILFKRIRKEAPGHERAVAFLEELKDREDVALSEFSLLELYVLLRTPALVKPELDAPTAAATIERLRRHPRWMLLGFPMESRPVHDELWARAGESGFARRRIYDLRMALALRASGVTDFATTNEKDFGGVGFRRVWNPLA